MNSPTITDADRREASLFLWCMDLGTNKELAQAFAAHREQARREALEEAAQVAVKHDTGDCTREDMEARRIAAAIRAL